MPRPRSGGNELYVVASTAPSRVRAGADFVCDGTADEVQIQAAIDHLATLNGGIVRLSPGAFTIASPIQLSQGIHVIGSGMRSTSISAVLANPFDMFQWHLTPTFTATASGGAAANVTFAGDVTASVAVGAVIRIKRGTGYGQKRTVVSRSYAGGTTTVVISSGSTNWQTNPDNTSVCQIDASQQLFAKLEGFTCSGRRKTATLSSGNDACIGTSAGAMTDAKLVDSVPTAFPSWVIGRSVYIYAGTGAGQMRYVEGRGQTGVANDTLLLDGPWYTALDGTSKYAVVGHGVGVYGTSCYDFILEDVWFTQNTGFGVMAEGCWGHVYKNLISEYNDCGGLYVANAPSAIAVTGGAWGSSTTGVGSNTGPKCTQCKIVDSSEIVTNRGGHGAYLFGRVIDSRFVCCEFGSDHENMHGILMAGSYGGNVKDNLVTGCSFCSWNNDAGGAPDNAGVYLSSGAVYNNITGNVFRTSATLGCKYAIYVDGGQSNLIANNVGDISATESFIGGSSAGDGDNSGYNLYRNNLAGSTREQDHFCGLAQGPATAGVITHTYPNALITTPSATDLVATITPADPLTAAIAGWFVQSVSATQLVVKSPNATAATTCVGAITANASPQSVEVGDSTGFVTGGKMDVAAGGGTAETVTITAVADGTHVSGIFTSNHDAGTAIVPRYQFHARVEQECRRTGNL